jgi:hypothetical protein
VVPKPSSVRTLPIRSSTPGATAYRIPLVEWAAPPTIPAQWVPWPFPSWMDPPGTKLLVFRPASNLPAKSGWSRSIPVSRTATVTPLPVNGHPGANPSRSRHQLRAVEIPESEHTTAPIAATHVVSPSNAEGNEETSSAFVSYVDGGVTLLEAVSCYRVPALPIPTGIQEWLAQHPTETGRCP